MSVISIILHHTWYKKRKVFKTPFVMFYFRFAGIMMGCSNTLASLPGMIAPSVTSALTPHVSKTKLLERKMRNLAHSQVGQELFPIFSDLFLIYHWVSNL